MNYIIICHRGSGSVFGAADGPLKRNGEIVTFETKEDAENEKQRLNARTSSYHVWYSVGAINEGF